MNDLILQVLRGEDTPRRPIWIMRQAGRYLPEYRALRAQHSFEDLSTNPELAAEVTLQPLERFPLDGAIVFADLMTPVTALGVDFHFDPGPVVPDPIKTLDQIMALHEPAPSEIGREVMETLERVDSKLDGRAALLGFGGGPWSIAAYLVEGRGNKNFPGLRKMAFEDPEALDVLLGKLARLVGGYLVEQGKHGARAVQVFETWSGILPREQWARQVKPHLRTVLEMVGAASIPRILFLQDAPHLVEEALDLPFEGISVDWRVDLPALREQMGPTRAIQGNLDPACLLAGPGVTRREALKLLERMPAKGHIFNLGHGILPEVPIASVEALIETVQSEVMV